MSSPPSPVRMAANSDVVELREGGEGTIAPPQPRELGLSPFPGAISRTGKAPPRYLRRRGAIPKGAKHCAEPERYIHRKTNLGKRNLRLRHFLEVRVSQNIPLLMHSSPGRTMK